VLFSSSVHALSEHGGQVGVIEDFAVLAKPKCASVIGDFLPTFTCVRSAAGQNRGIFNVGNFVRVAYDNA
jgi:hypothetical protein